MPLIRYQRPFDHTTLSTLPRPLRVVSFPRVVFALVLVRVTCDVWLCCAGFITASWLWGAWSCAVMLELSAAVSGARR